jgi:hypothetical protein
VFVFRDIVLLQKKIIVIFQENIISRRITTKTSANGIFYMVVERVEHYFDVCSGQLIVSCVVGKIIIEKYSNCRRKDSSGFNFHRSSVTCDFFLFSECKIRYTFSGN